MTELERYKAALEVIATTYPGQSTAGNVARTALEKPEPPTIAQLCDALEQPSHFSRGCGMKETT